MLEEARVLICSDMLKPLFFPVFCAGAFKGKARFTIPPMSEVISK